MIALVGEQVTCMACGSGNAHTLCAMAAGNVYSWGDGDYGKLGRGGNEGCKLPKKIESLTGKGVIKLLCVDLSSLLHSWQMVKCIHGKGHVLLW